MLCCAFQCNWTQVNAKIMFIKSNIVKKKLWGTTAILNQHLSIPILSQDEKKYFLYLMLYFFSPLYIVQSLYFLWSSSLQWHRLLPDVGWEEARPTSFLPLPGNWPVWPCICIVSLFCISQCICIVFVLTPLALYWNQNPSPSSPLSSSLLCTRSTPGRCNTIALLLLQEGQMTEWSSCFIGPQCKMILFEGTFEATCLCAILSLEGRMSICIPVELFAV